MAMLLSVVHNETTALHLRAQLLAASSAMDQ
jgi:hypothetical protein